MKTEEEAKLNFKILCFKVDFWFLLLCLAYCVLIFTSTLLNSSLLCSSRSVLTSKDDLSERYKRERGINTPEKVATKHVQKFSHLKFSYINAKFVFINDRVPAQFRLFVNELDLNNVVSFCCHIR
jgi:hypothetical protein